MWANALPLTEEVHSVNKALTPVTSLMLASFLQPTQLTLIYEK